MSTKLRAAIGTIFTWLMPPAGPARCGRGARCGDRGADGRVRRDVQDRVRAVGHLSQVLEVVTKSAVRHGIVPMWWDNGYPGDHEMGLFNRATGAQDFPDLIRTIASRA